MPPLVFINSPHPCLLRSPVYHRNVCLRASRYRHPEVSRIVMLTQVPPEHPPLELSVSPATASLPTPRHWRLPFIGMLLDFLLFKVELPVLAARYGPVYATDVFGVRTLVVTDLLAVRAILADCASFRSGSIAFPPTVRGMFGTNALILSDGATHSAKRALIAPAFLPRRLRPIVDISVVSARQLWAGISDRLTEDESSFDVQPAMNEHFLRIIQAVTGVRDRDRMAALFARVLGGMATVPFGPAWADANDARQELLRDIDALVRQKLATDGDRLTAVRAAGGVTSHRGSLDLLDILIVSSPEGADDTAMSSICETVVELWIAGYATQTSTLMYAVGQLSVSLPATVQRLREEQEKHKDLSYDAVTSGMPLLSSFVLEVTRFYAPLFAWPRIAACPARVCGHEVREGDCLSLDFIAAHRNERYFKNAASFNPWRFVGPSAADEEKKVLAFGVPGSPHYCVGSLLAKLNLNVSIAVMLREFDTEFTVRAREGVGDSKELIPVVLPGNRPLGGVIATKCRRRTSGDS